MSDSQESMEEAKVIDEQEVIRQRWRDERRKG